MNESHSVDVHLPRPVLGAEIILKHWELVAATPMALPIERRQDKTVIIGQVSARLPYLDLAVEPLRDDEQFGILFGFNPDQTYEGLAVMTWTWEGVNTSGRGWHDQTEFERAVNARADVMKNMLGG